MVMGFLFSCYFQIGLRHIFKTPHKNPHGVEKRKRMRPGRGDLPGLSLCLFDLVGGLFLERVAEDVSCPADAFLVGVGVHLQGNSLVGVAQLLRYRGDVGAVGDGDTCKRVAELVGVEILDAVLLGEPFEIPGRRRGVHRVSGAALCENIGRQSGCCLLQTKLFQEIHHLRPHVNGTDGFRRFRCVCVSRAGRMKL